jgi:ADP-heptose:LPS heptosyltransferase
LRRILVIKLGALGDFVHAMHAFAAIRAHHADDSVTLLTTAPYAAMARAAPWFDAVEVDPRAPWWKFAANRRIVRDIKSFDLVYDLQTSHRSNRYFKLSEHPAWSGNAPGCRYPHRNPKRDFMHTIERQRDQLADAGVTETPIPERTWLIEAGHRHFVPSRYALLMPGGAGVGDAKRWPAGSYAMAALQIAGLGLTPVVIGGPAEADLGRLITVVCATAIDLTGKTSFADIAALGAGAALVLGNDTGPVHLAASVGAPTVQLLSSATVLEQAAARGPRGEWVPTLQAWRLPDVTVSDVMKAVVKQLALPKSAGFSNSARETRRDPNLPASGAPGSAQPA